MRAPPASVRLASLTASIALTLLSGQSAAAGEVARSHQGVEVDVPEGFRWREGVKPKASTVLFLDGLERGRERPAILINAMPDLAAGMTDEQLFELSRPMFPAVQRQEVVELPSGRFLVVDFEVDLRADPEKGTRARRLRQRCYVTLQHGVGYYVFLANLSVERFEVYTARFDAMVAGARFFPPEPAPPEPAETAGASEAAPEEEPAPEAPAQPNEPSEPPPPAPEVARDPALTLELVRFDSEYDPDHWAAAHLVDGSSERGWCSAPGREPPHAFVLRLAAPAVITRVELDTPAREAGFEGASARAFELAGAAAEGGPFRPLAAGELTAGRGGQGFEVAEGEPVRWLQLTLRSNHGHATLTELMELRAYGRAVAEAPAPAPAPAPAESLRLGELTLAHSRAGPPLGQSASVAPGQRLWVSFKPRGLRPGDDGQTWLEVDLVLEDGEGQQLLRRDRVVSHRAPPPRPPLAPVVRLYLDVPPEFPAGIYRLRLLARDQAGDASAAAQRAFLVVAGE